MEVPDLEKQKTNMQSRLLRQTHNIIFFEDENWNEEIVGLGGGGGDSELERGFGEFLGGRFM